MIENAPTCLKLSTDDFHRPASIRHLGDIPLYRAVAWWGFFLGTEFTYHDVSLAFRIDMRRASGVLSYICNRHKLGDIAFRVRMLPAKHGKSLMSVQILSVADSGISDREYIVTNSARQKPSTGNHDRLLARWLLSRPVSNDTRQLGEWRQKCPCRIDDKKEE